MTGREERGASVGRMKSTADGAGSFGNGDHVEK